ncbi:MAG: hypothetical protein ABSE17_01490 [Candidatus Levyibacteriota bacterium]
MVKLWNFFKNNLLKIGISFLLVFIAWYPKLPSVHIAHTWVYIRLEDFSILLVVGIWFLQFILRRVKLPPKIWLTVPFYWGIGLISLVLSLIFIGPHLANFFPSVAALYYVRHIEYLILFFVAFSTIKSTKDVRDYVIILLVTVFGFSLYAFGQRFYLDAWVAFPHFFEKYPYCFPSFQTGNEEFAKGIPLCLPKDARITSTFAGHYDLAGYLVLVIPILVAVLLFVKKRLYQILGFIVTLISIMVLIFTASRISFVAYLLGLTATLVLIKRKKLIIPFYILSIVLLLIFSGSTAKRFMETFRFMSVVTNNQGQVVGQLPSSLQGKISNNIIENVPTQNLPEGSGYFGLPQLSAPQKTNQALVQSALSIEQARKLKLENGGVEISTVSGSFLVKKVLVYDISFTTRFQAEWPNAWNAFLRDPLFGSGFATITLAVDNNYLRILGETGLLGMVSFLSIFFVLALILKQALPAIKDKMSRAYLLGITGGLIGLFFNAVLIDIFESSKVAETLWILLGIGAGVIFLYKKDFDFKKPILKILTSHPFVIFYLLFISLAVFLKSVGNFFVADDFTWLKWAATTNLSDLPKFFINSQGFFYRPLDKVLMFFLYTLFSFAPQGYHLSMLLVHFLIGLGVYIIVQKLFGKKLFSFLGALIFLLLPSQAENVFWISTMSINISALFIIYMLIFWMNFRNKGSIINYITALVLAVLAFSAYEGAIVVLPLVILFDLFISKVKIYKLNAVLSYLPLAALTVAYPFIRIATQSLPPSGDYSYNLPHLIPNVVGNFIGYLGLMLVGEPSLPWYNFMRDTLKTETLYIAVALITILILVCLALFVYRNKLKGLFKNETAKWILFALLFSFVSLIPFLGLGNITERYSYLASVGFAILAIIVLSKILAFIKNNNYKLIFVAIIVFVVGGWYLYQNNLENANWSEAGRVTNRTLAYLRLYHDGNHPNSGFYFVNPPIKYGQAWIFPVGLPDGVWFIYRDPSISVNQLNSLVDGKAVPAKNADGSANFVFAFDQNRNIYELK